MNDTKYLSDGRKVRVIGKINQTEYIVQEIFVTEDGSEIPSGENFTSKSLHDNPVKSWKQKETEKYELRYNSIKKEIVDIEKELTLLKNRRQGHSDILKQNETFINLLSKCNIDNLEDILTGNVKYVVELKPYSININSFDDCLYDWECGHGQKKYRGLKTLSLMCLKSSQYASERKCSISIGDDIYDESAQGFNFFKNKEDLQIFLNKIVESRYKGKRLTVTDIDRLSRYIDIPDSILKDFVKTKIKEIEDNHEKAINQLEERTNNSIQELKEKLK